MNMIIAMNQPLMEADGLSGSIENVGTTSDSVLVAGVRAGGTPLETAIVLVAISSFSVAISVDRINTVVIGGGLGD
jgi:hypothetical protein